MDFHAFFRQAKRALRSLATNAYFWSGLAALLLLLLGAYFLFNSVLMPNYTRHDASVTVPRVVNQPVDQARQELEAEGLRVEQNTQRYSPDLPRDVVADQNPAPNSSVKPGRRVYLTVNSGETPSVKLPALKGTSLREARNRLRAVGLEADDLRVDSIPSPYPNTVTRQEPAPGDSLPKGASVTLWYSQSNEDAPYVTVPDVTGQTVRAAQQALLDRRLRSVVVSTGEAEGETENIESQTVGRQSREPGTSVREGFELRLFIGEPGDAEDAPAAGDSAGGVPGDA